MNKIIKKNQEQLNFFQPSNKIVKLTLDFISRIRKKLSKNKTYITGTNIRNKLNGLEENLRSCINDYNVKRNRITKLNPPLINLNEDEKNYYLI